MRNADLLEKIRNNIKQQSNSLAMSLLASSNYAKLVRLGDRQRIIVAKPADDGQQPAAESSQA